MNKKFWIGFVVVFVVFVVLDFLTNNVLLSSTYQEESMRHLWRPPADMKLWMFYVVDLIFAFMFTFVFSRGYEGKGVIEGVRYGLYIGILMAVPMAFSSYAAMPITLALALQWFIIGLVECVIAGIAVALVYGKQAMVARV